MHDGRGKRGETANVNCGLFCSDYSCSLVTDMLMWITTFNMFPVSSKISPSREFFYGRSHLATKALCAQIAPESPESSRENNVKRKMTLIAASKVI